MNRHSPLFLLGAVFWGEFFGRQLSGESFPERDLLGVPSQLTCSAKVPNSGKF